MTLLEACLHRWKHRVSTFQEEYLEFLKESGISYDERHLWWDVRNGLAPLSRRTILHFRGFRAAKTRAALHPRL